MAEDVFTPNTPLRLLGPLEQYSTVRSHLGIYNNVAVTATYKKPPSESVKPHLFRAVAAVIAKHPILSAVPVDTDTTRPHFVRLPRVELDAIISFVKTMDVAQNPALDKIIEEQHNRPFRHESPMKPFWRLLVLETSDDSLNFTLCFCFHHALADTKSALVFLEDLEHSLSHPSDAPESITVPITKAPLLPCMEELYHLPVSVEFLARQQNSTEPGPEIWSGAAQALPVRSRFSSFRLSAETTRGLQMLSQKQGVSLTSTLMAILAASFFSVLPSEFTTIHGDCAVSLRRFLPAPIDAHSMGCYVGSLSECYTRNAPTSSIWSDARRTKATIETVIAKEGADMPVGYLQHVPDMAVWFRNRIGRKRAAAFELSNVGALENVHSGAGSWRIEGLLFSQSASATAGAVKVSTVTGRDAELTVGFSWQDGVVEEQLIKRLKTEVSMLIDKLVRENISVNN